VDSDREDVARLRRGDTTGLAGLMSRHQDRLFRYLLRLVGDEAVEDVFQQSWLRAVERISRYDASRPFGPWLFAVARNLALDHLRRRRPESLDESGLEPEAPADPDNVKLGMSGIKAHQGAAGLTAFDKNGDVVRYPRLFVVYQGRPMPLEKFTEQGLSLAERRP